MIRAAFDRWLARRAFNALYTVMTYQKMTCSEYNECVVVLDILRRKIHPEG